MSENMIAEVVKAVPNRRKFLKTLGIASAAVGAIGLSERPAQAQSMLEVEVLNFALNLEYLEAEFYTYALYGVGIEHFGIEVSGNSTGGNPAKGGTTTGGHKVAFSNDLVFTPQIATQIGADERAHVSLLRSFLGSSAVAKPNINLNALGLGFANETEFLTLARIFEDIGVSAYGGAAGLLTTSLVITTAARILATEAEHVGSIRTQVARLNVKTPMLDGADIVPPPSGTQDHYLSVNTANGLPAVRTPGEVLYLAYGNKANATSGGFFPNGVNGNIRSSTTAATSANLGTYPPK